MSEIASPTLHIGPLVATTINASGPVTLSSTLAVTGAVSLGAAPVASSGIIRLPNNEFIRGRRVGDDGNVTLIGADSSDRTQIGTVSFPIIIPNLAGAGTRAVVVDANGVLSAP